MARELLQTAHGKVDKLQDYRLLLALKRPLPKGIVLRLCLFYQAPFEGKPSLYLLL